jgi:hypothetical protein
LNDVLLAPSATVFDRCNFVANNCTSKQLAPRKAGIVAVDARQVGSNALFQDCKFKDNYGVDVETDGATAWSEPPLAMYEITESAEIESRNETMSADEMPKQVKEPMLSLEDDELLQIQQVPLQLACSPVRVATLPWRTAGALAVARVMTAISLFWYDLLGAEVVRLLVAAHASIQHIASQA